MDARCARLTALAGSLLVLGCAVAKGAEPDRVVRLDFGPSDSPLRPGFLRVTPEALITEDASVGWVSQAQLAAQQRPIERGMTFRESSGRSYPPPVYATDLTCDHVQGEGPAALVFRLPDGPYRAWVLSGAAGGNSAQVWDIGVASDSETSRATFPGDCESRVQIIRAQARGGVLRLRFQTRSRWLANAVVVVPDDMWQEVKNGELAAIEKEVFLLPDDVLKEWSYRPHEDESPMPELSEEQRTTGFIVFGRSYLSPIWANTVPRRRELGPVLRAFASRDEYEPLTFTIHPLRDFTQIDVSVSDLRSESGETISREDIDVRSVRYMYVRPNYSSYGTYLRAPDVLMPWAPQPLVKGENLRVWLTVYSGPQAADDVYRGAATVRVDGEDAATVPIVFRVLDISLQKDRSLVYGHYYRHPYDQMMRAPDAFSGRWWQRKAEYEHADMVAHGNNTTVMGLSGRRRADGKWAIDYDRFEDKLRLARRHGFHPPIICHIPVGSLYGHYMKQSMGSHLRLVKMPPRAFFDELTGMVRGIHAEAQRRQWPELLYYPVDEPSRSDISVQYMVEVMKAIRRVPGARTYITADPAHEEFKPLKPHVNVWCCQPFSLDRETVVADMRERDVEYWCYPNHVAGENNHTPVAGSRMTYGFGFWRSGFRALTPWIYQSIVGDQWNYLDGYSMDFFNRTDDDGSPIPVMMWEAYREGIDDGRYVTTLARTIDRAREAGLIDAAEAAEADLELVSDAIPVLPKYKHDGMWDPETFDVYRWVLAHQILRLNSALSR